MAGNVVSLSGEAIVAGEPNPAAIAELEEWLERARSGDVIGVAIAAHYQDGATGSRWGGTLSRSLVGQCFSLAHRITHKLEDDN